MIKGPPSKKIRNRFLPDQIKSTSYFGKRRRMEKKKAGQHKARQGKKKHQIEKKNIKTFHNRSVSKI